MFADVSCIHCILYNLFHVPTVGMHSVYFENINKNTQEFKNQISYFIRPITTYIYKIRTQMLHLNKKKLKKCIHKKISDK